MKAKLKLPRGTVGFFNDQNEWVCTGSAMGRRNVLPDDTETKCKLHLQRLKLTGGGCYDQGGAYWGSPDTVWIAFTCHHVYSPVQVGVELIPSLQVYVRANHRGEAKQKVRSILPSAKFYR